MVEFIKKRILLDDGKRCKIMWSGKGVAEFNFTGRIFLFFDYALPPEDSRELKGCFLLNIHACVYTYNIHIVYKSFGKIYL